MLAAAVDARKGLFVEQAHQAVLCRHLLHKLHGKLVVVGGDVGGRVDGCQFMLGRCHLIVFGLGKDPPLPQLIVQLGHVRRHSGLDHAEVMVVHFLALGRLCAEQRAAGKPQIRALVIHLLGDQEVFLLRADGGADTFHIVIAKEPQDTQGLLVQRFHGAQQGRFLVQRFAAVGAEGGGDAQGLVLDKGVGGRVPGGIASCLKGGPQSAGGEGRRIRFALDQLLAGKFHDNAAVGRGGDKAVMLFGGDAGQRLEPMGVVGCAVGDGPILHRRCHGIGDADIELCALVDGLLQGLIYRGRQGRFHHSVIKDQASEIVRYSSHGEISFAQQ